MWVTAFIDFCQLVWADYQVKIAHVRTFSFFEHLLGIVSRINIITVCIDTGWDESRLKRLTVSKQRHSTKPRQPLYEPDNPTKPGNWYNPNCVIQEPDNPNVISRKTLASHTNPNNTSILCYVANQTTKPVWWQVGPRDSIYENGS